MIKKIINRSPDFADVTMPCEGRKNTGGTQTNVYYASVCDFDVIPTVPANPATMADVAKITANFTFKPGKKFSKFYTTEGTSEVKSTGVGETDGRSFEITAEVFHPGTEVELLGFATMINNASTIWLVPDADGVIRVIGSEAFPAKISANDHTTGKATADRKGSTFVLKSKGHTVAPVYSGTIQVTPTP